MHKKARKIKYKRNSTKSFSSLKLKAIKGRTYARRNSADNCFSFFAAKIIPDAF
jgi:hypothetical protein